MINLILGFSGYFLNTLTGYICRMVFVRCLSAEYLGINGLFSNVLSMLSLAELGIGGAIGFALYKPLAYKDEEKIASLMRFYARAYSVIGCVVGAAGLLLMPFLNFIIQEPPQIQENINLIYLIYLFNTAISYFFSYKGALLIASQRNYIVMGVNYAVTIIQSLLQIPALLISHNYLLYLGIQTIGLILNNIIVSTWATHVFPFIDKKDVRPLDKDEKKSLFVNVKALTINKLCTILVNNTDNIVLTYFSGLISVGMVSNYNLFVSTLGTLTSQLFSSLTASIGNLNALESKEKKYSFFRILNLSNFWIFGWCAIGITFVSGDLVRLCFGDNYVMVNTIPLILAVNFYLVGMQNAVYAYKNTMGLFRYGQYLLLFTAGINLVLDIILGRTMGVLGIYLATAIARCLTNVWYEPYAVFKHGLNTPVSVYLKKYLEYLVVLVLTGFGCMFFCNMCHFSIAVNVALKIFICSVIPNGVFFVIYHRTDEFAYLKTFVQKLVKKILKFGEKR